ncbi:MAG: hypothetical protein M3014_08055 [Chloroflexota bacterium]|nr:hypothetical protein [Chloroflexota bacterium]
MALKLHTSYGFSYSNLKVLLGGWNGWKDANSKNPSAYPIATGSAFSALIAQQDEGCR